MTKEKVIIEGRPGNKPRLKIGLIWGLLIWVSMSILLPIHTDIQFSVRLVLINLPIAMVCGLLFGLGMRWISKYLKSARPQDGS